MRTRFSLLFYWLTLILFVAGCKSTDAPSATINPSRTYQTKHVIVVVIDGVRYADAWGDTTYSLIPHMAQQLAPLGAFHSKFYNLGKTLTNPGHVALTTGAYQSIKNNGTEIPQATSVFHYYRQQTSAPATDAWVITSKDKLEILARTQTEDSVTAFAPATDCGVKGLGTGYRADSTTIRVAKQILGKYHPHLVLINLRAPDSEAHAGHWSGYLNAIKSSDQYVYELWQWLQKDPKYRGTTTLLVTNDHGRHTGKNFTDHGDDCEGCRHISLLALGPDVKKDFKATTPRSQVDVAATIAELLNFRVPKRDGVPMLELFEPNKVSSSAHLQVSD